METLEEDDMTNEKDLISKDWINKSNSIALKSVDETIFNFYELLEENFF